MLTLSSALLTYVRAFFLSHHELSLEILALRQQVCVLKRRHPRPRLTRSDRLFWLTLSALWGRWRDALIVVKPETVVGWHKAGFRLYWRFVSRAGRLGRRKIDADVYRAIERIAKENPSWGAPRVHGELVKLGFSISERTVSRYMARRTPGSDEARQKWASFLSNHREVLVAMDFFAVPTITFKLLYCFFVIEHGRRRILHFYVTAHPTAEWVCQQLREAFPNESAYKHAVLDRDSKFSQEVFTLLKASGITAVRTSIRSPWQNGIAERWVGTARRECFDHVLAINEAHVRRLGREFVAYYHEDRTHLGLDKETPTGRNVQCRPDAAATLESLPRIGGLHHRYVWKTAA